MRPRIVAIVLGASMPVVASGDLERVLARLGEEADVFAAAATKTIGQETLRQKALKPRPRFRLRAGQAALKPPPREYQTREIVSEYGFTTFEDNPGAVHEIRQVVRVDGREIRQRAKARETLTLGLTSADDRRKKKMLQEFERYGLIGAVTDFGQLLLLFSKRNLPNYSFKPAGNRMLGADAASVFEFEQVAGPELMTIFQGREAIRRKLEGSLWVRESDHLPLRILLRSQYEADKRTIVSEGSVDYSMSRFGTLLPVSVTYREHEDGNLLTENVFEYRDFRQFGAESEIKFEADPKN